jgi:hypothetical protein
MTRPRRSRAHDITGEEPVDLYDYARPSASRLSRTHSPGRPTPDDPSAWTVKDDWPEDVAVTEAEIEVFEAWFGDLFDELFSPRH